MQKEGVSFDMLTLLLRLPFLPIEGVVRLAGLIEDQAEREFHDPAAVRRELEAAADARAAGTISDAELAEIERQATARLVGQSVGPA
jgi:Gas vesicle protein G